MKQAFSRVAAFAALLSSQILEVGRQQALATVGPYKSRGKGMGKGASQFGTARRNKSQPHEGKKQNAKRNYYTAIGANGHATMRQFPKGYVLSEGVGV